MSVKLSTQNDEKSRRRSVLINSQTKATENPPDQTQKEETPKCNRMSKQLAFCGKEKGGGKGAKTT